MLTELKAAAANNGTTASDLARLILAQGLGSAVLIAAPPDPKTEAKFRTAMSAKRSVDAVGNLMNQIAQHGHIMQELGPYAADLREAIRHNERVSDALLDVITGLVAA